MQHDMNSGIDWGMAFIHFISMIVAMGVYDFVKSWFGKKH